MLRLNSVSKYFNRHTPSEVLALNAVSLHLKTDEFLVVIGSNGSGKSTLLNLIAGNILADSGSILIGETEVTRLPDFKRSRWVSRVFQDPLKGTAPDLSILDNFRLAALRTKQKGFRTGITTRFRNEVRAKLSLLHLGLENKPETPMGRLSGGQRQAITLLMASMDAPDILLLDEPTAALDPRSSATVMHLASQLISENHLTAIMVTHNLRHALDYGTRLIRMDEGKIVRDLSREEKMTLELNQIQQWFA